MGLFSRLFESAANPETDVVKQPAGFDCAHPYLKAQLVGLTIQQIMFDHCKSQFGAVRQIPGYGYHIDAIHKKNPMTVEGLISELSKQLAHIQPPTPYDLETYFLSVISDLLKRDNILTHRTRDAENPRQSTILLKPETFYLLYANDLSSTSAEKQYAIGQLNKIGATTTSPSGPA